SGMEGRDPYEDYVTINQELKSYNENLSRRPQIVVANKMDLPDSETQLEMFKEQLQEDVNIIPISTVTRHNVDKLLYQIADLLDETEGM
ncbi:GTPase ObgE, partial [Staphylococcus aureus]|nr:GTPase ObgE [Staphylococcus aureus]